MRYWYLKEPCVCRHSGFSGIRELIYKGIDSPERFLVRYQDDIENTPKPWRVEWKELKEYNPVYYPHTAAGMTEITEEEFKKIISLGKK